MSSTRSYLSSSIETANGGGKAYIFSKQGGEGEARVYAASEKAKVAK